MYQVAALRGLGKLAILSEDLSSQYSPLVHSILNRILHSASDRPHTQPASLQLQADCHKDTQDSCPFEPGCQHAQHGQHRTSGTSNAPEAVAEAGTEALTEAITEAAAAKVAAAEATTVVAAEAASADASEPAQDQDKTHAKTSQEGQNLSNDGEALLPDSHGTDPPASGSSGPTAEALALTKASAPERMPGTANMQAFDPTAEDMAELPAWDVMQRGPDTRTLAPSTSLQAAVDERDMPLVVEAVTVAAAMASTYPHAHELLVCVLAKGLKQALGKQPGNAPT